MPKLDTWMERIRGPEREFQAVRASMVSFRQQARRDPSILPGQLSPRDLDRAWEALEPTYLIRLFAVFEAGLREVWRDAYERPTEPQMTDLLNAFEARCTIPHAWLMNAHAVREYRNRLIHGQDEDEPGAIPLETARGWLLQFFSRLPRDW